MSTTDILSPLEQEGTKSIVRAWLRRPGDAVKHDDPIVELETDKVSVEVAAPADGVLAEILLQVGDEAPPGTVLGRLRDKGTTTPLRTAEPISAHAAAPAAATPGPSIAQFDPGLRLSPSVRRALIEHAIDPKTLRGSGRNGRITHEDVIHAMRGSPTPAPMSKEARFVPHDPMRRRIAEHMAASLATAPHVTAVFEADFSAIAADRVARKAEFEKAGIALTTTAYLIAAAAQAMNAAPAVNSRWHEQHLEIFDDVNIGVGTALGDKGLVVPVIHGVQNLSFRDIAARLDELTKKARADRLVPADVRGGTFTISNHGVSGSLLAAPIIINQPQSAILGVGRVEKRVIVREVAGADTIQIRAMAYVSLTIDHRVLDGHQTNAWLTRFVEVIETWPRALTEGKPK